MLWEDLPDMNLGSLSCRHARALQTPTSSLSKASQPYWTNEVTTWRRLSPVLQTVAEYMACTDICVVERTNQLPARPESFSKF